MTAADVLGAVGVQSSSGSPSPAWLCPASVSPCSQGTASSAPAASSPWELVEGLICHRPTVQSGETEARESLAELPRRSRTAAGCCIPLGASVPHSLGKRCVRHFV